MENNNYKIQLKEKQMQVLNLIYKLENNILSKMNNKDNRIIELEKHAQSNYDIEEYKENKNKELNILKQEMNTILLDITKIINDITN